jgi:hypothetical protein
MNELLGEADPICSLLFIGLWCLADREGRLEDRPKRIKAEIFPYRDLPDFNGYLTVLEQLGFIDRYEADENAIIQVLNFGKHQSPHKTEKAGCLPKKQEKTNSCDVTVKASLGNGALTDEAALIPDSGFSDSLIPDSGDSGVDPPGADAPPPEKQKQSRFIAPTVDQVREYCLERKNSIDPQKFVDHYQANGWMRGKSKVKDWKACVRTWEQNQSNHGSKSNDQPNPFSDDTDWLDDATYQRAVQAAERHQAGLEGGIPGQPGGSRSQGAVAGSAGGGGDRGLVNDRGGFVGIAPERRTVLAEHR